MPGGRQGSVTGARESCPQGPAALRQASTPPDRCPPSACCAPSPRKRRAWGRCFLSTGRPSGRASDQRRAGSGPDGLRGHARPAALILPAHGLSAGSGVGDGAGGAPGRRQDAGLPEEAGAPCTCAKGCGLRGSPRPVRPRGHPIRGWGCLRPERDREDLLAGERGRAQNSLTGPRPPSPRHPLPPCVSTAPLAGSPLPSPAQETSPVAPKPRRALLRGSDQCPMQPVS